MTPQVAGMFKALDAMDKAEPGTPLRTALQMQKLAEALREVINFPGARIGPNVLKAARTALAEYEASHA